jgi:hypothetical protein
VVARKNATEQIILNSFLGLLSVDLGKVTAPA